MEIKRFLIPLLLLLLLGVPGIHKLLGDLPPDWFQEKFTDSLINAFPGSLLASYILIILLEVSGALLFILGLVRLEFRYGKQPKYIRFGFLVCYVLFIILTFGSFLVEDYSNGFKDFMYFVGIIVLEHLFFPHKE